MRGGRRPGDIEISSTKEGREFLEKYTPKKFRSTIKWAEEYNKVRAENVGELTRLIEYGIAQNVEVLRYAKIIMEMPDCPPALYLKAGEMVQRGSRVVNDLIHSLYKMQKEFKAEPSPEVPKHLPPDFTESTPQDTG